MQSKTPVKDCFLSSSADVKSFLDNEFSSFVSI